MPSEAAEKSERRAKKRRERESRIPKAMQGTRQVLVTWEEFRSIFKEAMVKEGAKEVKYSTDGEDAEFSHPDMLAPDMTLSASVRNLYEKHKFSKHDDCLESLSSQMRHTIASCAELYGKKSELTEVGESPDNLFLTVKTHAYVRRYERPLLENPGEHRDHLVYRPFSSHSGELFVAVVRGLPGIDTWIPSKNLKKWKLTEEEAFDVCVKNIDKITPANLGCQRVSGPEDLRKHRGKRESFVPITHMSMGKKTGGGGSLIVEFADQRALPRLLLPRVVERLADVLRCKPTSLVVVPAEDGAFRAASAEDPMGMLTMAIHQILPYCQGDNPHVQHKVSWNPFRVTTLCNDKGLVEIEPYVVDGGRIAVQFWEAGKMKVFHPYPRTADEIHFLEEVYKSKRKMLSVLTESEYLAGVCWKCREECDKLKTCGNCLKAKYCSKDCQKAAWSAGHNVNCEERRHFWEKARRARASSAMAEKGQEARAGVTQEDLERMRKVTTQ